jgi:hypothetical protein
MNDVSKAHKVQTVSIMPEKYLIAVGEAELSEVTGIQTLAKGQDIAMIAAGAGSRFAVTKGGTLLGACSNNKGFNKLPFESFMANAKNKIITSISAGCDGGFLAATAEGELITADERYLSEKLDLTQQKIKGKYITTVCVGGSHSFALTKDGEVISAGDERGLSDFLQKIQGKKIALIAAGEQSGQSMAVTSEGKLIISDSLLDKREVDNLLEKTEGKIITSIRASCSGQLTAVAQGYTLFCTTPREHIPIESWKSFLEQIKNENIRYALAGGYAWSNAGGFDWPASGFFALTTSGRLLTVGGDKKFMQSLHDAIQGKVVHEIAISSDSDSNSNNILLVVSDSALVHG